MFNYTLRHIVFNAFGFFILTTSLVVNVANSQQQEPSQPTSSGEEKELDKPLAKEPAEPQVADKQKKENNKVSDPVFRPSEEISEDSPVPFPVDI